MSDLAALKNIGEGSGTAVDAARILHNRSETIAGLGLPPNSALVRKAEGLRRLGPDAFGMVANGLASEEHGDVVGRNVQNKDMQADILAMLTRVKPENLAQAAMIARDAAADSTTETQTDMFGTMQVQKSLYVERAKVLDAAMKALGTQVRTFGNLIDRAGIITDAGNILDADANAALVDSATKVRHYLNSQANMKGPISDALTEAAEALRSGTPVTRAAEGFIRDVKRGLEGGRGGSQAPSDGGRLAQRMVEEPAPAKPEEVTPPPAPEPGADLFGAMTGAAPTAPAPAPPGDDLLAAMGPALTAEQARTAAKAAFTAGKAAFTAGVPRRLPLDFAVQPDAARKAWLNGWDQANVSAPIPLLPGEALIQKGRDILEPFSEARDAAANARAGSDLRDTKAGRALAEDLAKAEGLEARAKIANAWVLKHGKARGVEHMVALDKDGTPLAIVSGRALSVSPHASVYRAAEAGLVAHNVHNHPLSSGPSSSDVAMLHGGFSPMTIMAHNGEMHRLEAVGVRGNVTRNDLGLIDLDITVEELDRVLKNVSSTANVAAHNLDGDKEAKWYAAVRPMFSLILERMGIVRYEGGTIADVEAEGFNFEDIYGQVSRDGSAGLRRAGFALTEGGDQGGDSAAGVGGTRAADQGAAGPTAPVSADGTGQGRVPASADLTPAAYGFKNPYGNIWSRTFDRDTGQGITVNVTEHSKGYTVRGTDRRSTSTIPSIEITKQPTLDAAMADLDAWLRFRNVTEKLGRPEATPDTTDAAVAAASADIDPTPTDGQKKAGNYEMGHVTISGLDLTLETAKGGTRSGTGPDGKKWSVTLAAHYGYIRGTKGKDKDHLDIYLGDFPDSDFVMVIDQNDLKTGKFDEHKIILGTENSEQALAIYKAGFSDGKADDRIGGVRKTTIAQLKLELKNPSLWKRPMSKGYQPGDAFKTTPTDDFAGAATDVLDDIFGTQKATPAPAGPILQMGAPPSRIQYPASLESIVPSGRRPPGARHQATQAAPAMPTGDPEALLRKALEKALAGDD